LHCTGDTRPERIGDYQVLREAGRGGMGVVYEAEELSLGRRVALKVLSQGGQHNPTFLERFRREAKAAARLHHTNIVPVFGVGEANGVHYYAMQFIHGQGLDKVLNDLRRLRHDRPASHDSPSPSAAHLLLSGEFEAAKGQADTPSTPAQGPGTTATLSGSQAGSQYYRAVARIGLQIAEALVYAHKQGIIHRDIKPSNLILDLQGTVWITDFGLAKSEGTDELTQTGDVVGTVRYMAPERFKGTSLVQGDVYSLGMTLYEMLALRPAFDDANRAQLIQRLLHEDPPLPRKSDPHIPRDLETIVLKACATDPCRRYPTAEALAEDLRRFLSDRPIWARRITSAERLWRWCRRNPAVASLTGAVAALLVAVAVAATMAAFSLDARKKEALEQLWRSKLNEAHAISRSRQPGQRFTSLERIREALAIARPLGLSEADRLEFRNAAIAALALPDFDLIKEGKNLPEGTVAVGFDSKLARYVLAQRDGTITIHQLEDERELATFRAEGEISGLRLSPDGSHVVISSGTGDPNATVQIWQLEPSPPQLLFKEKGLGAHYSDFSSDGHSVVFESSHQLHMVDLTSGKSQAWPLPGVQLAAAVRCRPGREQVAICRTINGKGTVQVRDLRSGRIVAELLKQETSNIAWHPDGCTLAVAYGNGASSICLWDPDNGREAANMEGHKFGGVALLFNRAGDRLLSTDYNGMVRVWDIPGGRQLQTLGGLQLFQATFRDDDALLATTYSIGGTQRLRLLRCARGSEVRTIVRRKGKETGWYKVPVFSRDGKHLAVVICDPPFQRFSGVTILDWPSGREIGELLASNTFPIAFDPDEALWTASTTGTVLRWPRSFDAQANATSFGMPEPIVDLPQTEARSLSTDGKTLVMANGHHGAMILNRDRVNQFFPTGAQPDVRYAAVSPDGKWVASGSHSAGARVCEAGSGRPVHSFHVPGPCNVGFSPDSHWLVTSGGGIRLWHRDSWQPGPVLQVEGDSLGWAFSADTRLLALAGLGRVRLVRPETGVEVVRLTSVETTKFEPLAFSHDGAELLVQGEDTQAIYVWDIRLLRKQLAELDLDWDDPPLPTSNESRGMPGSPTVRFLGSAMLADLEKLRNYNKELSILGIAANPFDANAHFQLAQLLETKQPEAAFVHYSATMAFQKDHPLAIEGRAATALRLKRWQQVIADATTVLKLHPDRYFALFYRARAFQELGRHAEAIADLTAIISIWPKEMRLYDLRAESYQAVGDSSRAEADRNTSAEIIPDDALKLNERAWNLLSAPTAKQDPPAALKLARRAVALAPNEAQYVNTLGVAEYRNGHFTEAIATLEHSLMLGNGRWDAFDLFFIAAAHHKLGDRTRAKEYYDRALNWTRNNGNTLSPVLIKDLEKIRAEVTEVLQPEMNSTMP
jgi:serine/threonine protein kinase/WD40 repeat protein/tetratricopeptide (TPR) repeat protein